MDVDLVRLASRQDDVVARWQLLAAGWSESAVEHRTAGLRVVHAGVFLAGHAPVTQRQRWRAAVLSAPASALNQVSGAACWSFRPHLGRIETIVRPGDGGPRRFGSLRVFRSLTLEGDVTVRDGLPITTAARTLLDLSPRLSDRALRKAFREALRLRVTTAQDVVATLDRHPGRRGTARLRALAERYARLPIHRTRSDAEAMALEVLDRARIPIPRVNEHVAGEEADLSWPEHRLIVEIDGPNFHRLRDEDARKTAVWRRAGHTVRRIPSDDVFDHPELLLTLATSPR